MRPRALRISGDISREILRNRSAKAALNAPIRASETLKCVTLPAYFPSLEMEPNSLIRAVPVAVGTILTDRPPHRSVLFRKQRELNHVREGSATIRARPLNRDRMDHERRNATETPEISGRAHSLLRSGADCTRCSCRCPCHHAKSLWDSMCHCDRFFRRRLLSTSEDYSSFFYPRLESAKTHVQNSKMKLPSSPQPKVAPKGRRSRNRN